jgi:hypothetical protein
MRVDVLASIGGEQESLSLWSMYGLLRGFRIADFIDFLRCRGRLLVSAASSLGRR